MEALHQDPQIRVYCKNMHHIQNQSRIIVHNAILLIKYMKKFDIFYNNGRLKVYMFVLKMEHTMSKGKGKARKKE